MSKTYTIQNMTIVDSEGNIYPLDLLNKYRLTSNPNQIGTRFYDEEWQSWTIVIKDVKEGTDITLFMTKK